VYSTVRELLGGRLTRKGPLRLVGVARRASRDPPVSSTVRRRVAIRSVGPAIRRDPRPFRLRPPFAYGAPGTHGWWSSGPPRYLRADEEDESHRGSAPRVRKGGPREAGLPSATPSRGPPCVPRPGHESPPAAATVPRRRKGPSAAGRMWIAAPPPATSADVEGAHPLRRGQRLRGHADLVAVAATRTSAQTVASKAPLPGSRGDVSFRAGASWRHEPLVPPAAGDDDVLGRSCRRSPSSRPRWPAPLRNRARWPR